MTIRSDGASQALYRAQGMGQRIGFGQRPAVLVIDMQHDFCDRGAPTSLWPSIGTTYEPIRRLCASARQRGMPVFYTQGLVAADGSSAGLWRYKQRYHAEGRVQVAGTRGADIIPELAPHPGDRIIRKAPPPHRACQACASGRVRHGWLNMQRCRSPLRSVRIQLESQPTPDERSLAKALQLEPRAAWRSEPDALKTSPGRDIEAHSRAPA